ncbi:MAG: HD domain-containing protein, partial [Planctomycetes bacterium]|nr:HD domain-containing protein [Planctomycetota bacterium]
MGSPPEVVPNKFVVDSIQGDIHLTVREWRILDTLAFQRLRNLKQLAMGQLTYPNATHTRFAHSLGTLGIMARILDVAKTNGLNLKKRQQENLRMAALLHDIGHYPYSHLMEQIDSVVLTEEEVQIAPTDGANKKALDTSQIAYPSHEKLGTEIVTNQRDLLTAIGGKPRAKEIAALFARTEAADPQLSKLIHSSLDMDRLDYLQRDSHAAGVPYGNIDVNYLLNSLQISPSKMGGVGG